jgi:hypothetical protein
MSKEEDSMEDGSAPKRRTLLQRGLALLAGAVGLGVAGGAGGDGVPAPGSGGTLRLYGRRCASPRSPRGDGLTRATHVISSGDLLEGPEGHVVGSFHTNALCLATPLGPTLAAASNIEFHTFTLESGTLFALAAGPAAAGLGSGAVIGGTGRFAGARGTYVGQLPSSGPQERGAVEFVFNLSA